MQKSLKLAVLAIAAAFSMGGHAQTYKIGIAAGLTGYAATVDRAWTDGVKVAVDVVNARGGVNGRKLEVIVEDNRSEPQEAVTVYRKMMSSDKVDIFLSGCVSAGPICWRAVRNPCRFTCNRRAPWPRWSSYCGPNRRC